MVLGLDLSSTNTGYAILDGTSLVTYGSIIPGKNANHLEKLLYIYNEIEGILGAYHIDHVAIEDQCYTNNVDTLKLLARISGVVMLCAKQHDIPVSLYPATTVKKHFTGNGQATKEDMIAKALELYNLQRCLVDDNICDAIGIAYTHVTYQETPKPVHKKKKKKLRRSKPTKGG